MAIDVSVVVPVYNPGVNLDACLHSLLAQTLEPHRYEVVLVDDGSTDGTAALLEQWGRREPERIRVIAIPNSGWPGRPRNVGAEAARGDYVHFVDNDDILAPHALERMMATARSSDADVVIGKLSSDFRIVNHTVFRDNAERVTWRDFPLVESLTPHKMFRTSLLRDHAIRFAEGPRHLEDQLFCMHAYAHASSVAVVADEPCYFYRRRRGFGRNAGDVPADPDDYYRDLESVLDVVDRHVDDTHLRCALYERFYRVEMLGRLRDRVMLDYNDDYRVRLFARVRDVADRRVPTPVDGRLPFLARTQARLLRDGDLDGMLALAHDLLTLNVQVATVKPTWREGRLVLDVDAQLTWRDEPWSATDAQRLGGGTMELDRSVADLVAVSRVDGVTWFVPPMLRVEQRPDGTLGVSGHVELDPRMLAGGGAVATGLWDIRLRVAIGGMTRTVALPLSKAPHRWCLYDAEPHSVATHRTPAGALALDVGEWVQSLTGDVADVARRDGDRTWAVDTVVSPASLSVPALLFDATRSRGVPASLAVSTDGARLNATKAPADADALWVRVGDAGRSAPAPITPTER